MLSLVTTTAHNYTEADLPILNGLALEAIAEAEKFVAFLGEQHPAAEEAISAAKQAVAAYVELKVALNPEDCASPTQDEDFEQLHDNEDWTIEFNDDGTASIHLA